MAEYSCLLSHDWTMTQPVVELLRAAVHQLHQREAAAAVQPHHVHPGAGGVPARGHRVELHRLWPRPAALH